METCCFSNMLRGQTMHAGSSAAFFVPLEKRSVLSMSSLGRTKKVVSPPQGYVDNGGGNINNNHGRTSAVDNVSLLQSAAAAAVGCQEVDVTPKVVSSFVTSLDLIDREELTWHSKIHALRDFQEIYKIRKFIGCGSYSVVFQVINRVTKEVKAAKFIVGKDTKSAGWKLDYDGDGNKNDRAMTAEEGRRGTEQNRGDRFTALSDLLVKEIAVSLLVHHPNLVQTSAVFVHDVEELRCRMRMCISKPFVVSSGRTGAGAKWNVVREDAVNTTHNNILPYGSKRSSFLRDSGTRHSSGGSSVCPPVYTRISQAVLDSVLDPNQFAIEKVKHQLQEGHVQCIIVMELLSGCDLFTLVSHNPLDEPRAASFMLDLLLALKYLHSHHIVHRDVKVENIVLDRHDRACLIDYGFCEGLHGSFLHTSEPKSETHGEYNGSLTQFCGSYHYVAPEVIRSAMQSRLSFKTSSARDGNNTVGLQLPPIFTTTGKLSGGAETGQSAPLENDDDSRRTRTAASTQCLRTRLARRQVGYGTPADLWSAGVVMFVLLHSAFPFHDGHLSKLLNLITSGRQQLRLSPLLSSEAKDLLQGLLMNDVSRRLTAAQALEHPWFKKMLGDKRGR